MEVSKGTPEAAAERRLQAFKLRKAGRTYREIGLALGVSHTQARDDVKQSLREYHDENLTEARELVAQMTARLEWLWSKVAEMIESGEVNPKLLEQARKLIVDTARLLDLQPPDRVEVKADIRQTFRHYIKEMESKTQEEIAAMFMDDICSGNVKVVGDGEAIPDR